MGERENILIVEDESIISLNIEYILSRVGYNVVGICNNAEKALDKLRTTKVDLVLMDIELRGSIDGIEIAGIIRKEFDIPVVFITAHQSEDIFSRAKSADPHAYILKPFTEKELEINIELVLLRTKSEKKIKSMQAALTKINSELEKKIYDKTAELQQANDMLREEAEISRKKSAALEQSEKDHRALFENSHDAILIIDPVTGIIKQINRKAYELYGFDENEFLRLTIQDLYFSESPGADYFGMIEYSGSCNTFESIHQKKNGQQIFVETSISVIQFKKQLALQFIVRDVTTRKKAEQGLVNSEKKYKDMTNFLPVPIFETDEEGKISYSNSTAAELFGYEAAEMTTGIQLADLILPDEREAIMKICMSKDPSRSKEGITFTALRKNGIVIKMMGYCSRYSRDEGQSGIRICMIDIGDLAKTQEQLMKFSMVIEQIKDSVIITDRSGKIEYVNPAFLSEYGFSMPEVIGRQPSIFKSNLHNSYFYKEMWERIGSGKIFSSEFVNRRKNGELYYEDKTITPLRDDAGKITHFVSTGRNIIEKKIAEKKIFEHQRFIDAINNTVPLVVFVYDTLSGKFTFVNNKIQPVLGYKPDDFIDMSTPEFIGLIHPGDRKMLPTIIGRENYDLDNVNEAVIRMKHHSGAYRIIQFRGVPFVFNQDKSAGQILGTALDITEQKFHERQLNAMLRLHRLQEKKEQKIRTISLLQGQEEERRRLSREMHDGIGQLLTAIKMKLDNMHKKTSPVEGELAAETSTINHIVKQAIVEVRRISNDLVPIGLYDFGLSSVLRQLLENVSDKKTHFSSDIGVARFQSAIEITFYRIFQETINNIQKHSNASSIDVTLSYNDNLLRMTVYDDGIGFMFNDQHPVTFIGKGNGLNNMYERARIIGGKYTIQTAPDRGCRIILEVNTKIINT